VCEKESLFIEKFKGENDKDRRTADEAEQMLKNKKVLSINLLGIFVFNGHLKCSLLYTNANTYIFAYTKNFFNSQFNTLYLYDR
jgi:hypothetical protein